MSAAGATTQHAGHVLLASGFVLVSLLAVAAGEQLKARSRRTTPSVLVVAGSGVAAGAIHLAVAPSHWAQAAVYGAFFVVAGVTQLVWSVLLLVRPSRALLGLNLAANLGLALLWLQTRTSGVPLGPAAGVRDRVGVVDLACVLLELLSVAVAGQLLLRRRLGRQGASGGPRPGGPTEGAARSPRRASQPAEPSPSCAPAAP